MSSGLTVNTFASTSVEVGEVAALKDAGTAEQIQNRERDASNVRNEHKCARRFMKAHCVELNPPES